MRRLRLVLIGLLLVLLIAAGGFVVWANTPPAPTSPALDALQSSSSVAVDTSRWIVFSPSADDLDTGFIFYPGGRVDARSYSAPLRSIA